MSDINSVDMSAYRVSFRTRFPIYADLLQVSISLYEYLRDDDFSAAEIKDLKETFIPALGCVIRDCANILTTGVDMTIQNHKKDGE